MHLHSLSFSSFASERISHSALPQSTICVRPHLGHWYSRMSRPVKVVFSIWSISTLQSGQVVSLIKLFRSYRILLRRRIGFRVLKVPQDRLRLRFSEYS